MTVALTSRHAEPSSVLSLRDELETSLDGSDGEPAGEAVHVDEAMSHVVSEGSTTRHESERSAS